MKNITLLTAILSPSCTGPEITAETKARMILKYYDEDPDAQVFEPPKDGAMRLKIDGSDELMGHIVGSSVDVGGHGA